MAGRIDLYKKEEAIMGVLLVFVKTNRVKKCTRL
jgi:hypothetical protein